MNRMTAEEKKMLDQSQEDIYQEVRLAAEAHRQVMFKISVLICQCGDASVASDLIAGLGSLTLHILVSEYKTFVVYRYICEDLP